MLDVHKIFQIEGIKVVVKIHIKFYVSYSILWQNEYEPNKIA